MFELGPLYGMGQKHLGLYVQLFVRDSWLWPLGITILQSQGLKTNFGTNTKQRIQTNLRVRNCCYTTKTAVWWDDIFQTTCFRNLLSWFCEYNKSEHRGVNICECIINQLKHQYTNKLMRMLNGSPNCTYIIQYIYLANTTIITFRWRRAVPSLSLSLYRNKYTSKQFAHHNSLSLSLHLSLYAPEPMNVFCLGTGKHSKRRPHPTDTKVMMDKDNQGCPSFSHQRPRGLGNHSL